MPRKPRIHYPGAVYHVILRGNAGQPVFITDRDRSRFCLFLQRAVEMFDCRIHAYCLMTNHIHVVIQTCTTPLSRIMQQISQRYTAWINFSHSRTGHVFQGRYKALLIDADSYLLELVRYVHLNPVRAGMTKQPDEYPWSSHRAYEGHEDIPWLTTEWVLSCLGGNAGDVRARYTRFVRDGSGELRRNEFHSGTHEGRILGDDVFAEEALAKCGESTVRSVSLQNILATACRVCGVTVEQLKSPGKQRPGSEARALAALLALETPSVSLTSLGSTIGRDIATLGRAARRLSASADAGVMGRILAARGLLENNRKSSLTP